MEGARVIGVISGPAETPQIAYLERGVSIGSQAFDASSQLAPTEVFRFAASCEERRCAHFTGTQCSLAARIVDQLPEVVDILPRCQIRATCRWYAEQGAAAC